VKILALNGTYRPSQTTTRLARNALAGAAFLFTSQNPNTTFIQAPGQTTLQAPSGSLTFEMVTLKP